MHQHWMYHSTMLSKYQLYHPLKPSIHHPNHIFDSCTILNDWSTRIHYWEFNIPSNSNITFDHNRPHLLATRDCNFMLLVTSLALPMQLSMYRILHIFQKLPPNLHFVLYAVLFLFWSCFMHASLISVDTLSAANTASITPSIDISFVAGANP